jgi:hypothetical protein
MAHQLVLQSRQSPSINIQDNHTLPSSTPLPLLPLAAPVSIMVSLLLQLMKATTMVESFCFLSVLWTFYALWQSADMSQVDVVPFSPL